MKKAILILVPILFLFVGCTNDGEAPYESEATTAPGSIDQEDRLGNFTFFEGRSYSDDRDTGIDVISLEEAAEIGAYYIFEVLGENLDGMYMELAYNYNFHISHRTWVGFVNHSRREGLAGQLNAPISFVIDAETGERLFLSYSQLEPLHGISGEMMESMPVAELLEIFPDPDEAEIAEMMEVVREIAERHLQTSEIVTIEYGFWQENGDLHVTFDGPSQFSPFFIIDTEGRVIDILIQRETHLLSSINVLFDTVSP